MSFAIVAVAAATVISAGVSYYNGQQQVKASQKAADMARENALLSDKQAEQAMNAQNQKRPDQMAILGANTNKAGTSGTMLTGSQGIDPSALQLGKNTLLGS